VTRVAGTVAASQHFVMSARAPWLSLALLVTLSLAAGHESADEIAVEVDWRPATTMDT
jgi:hypothetical protein